MQPMSIASVTAGVLAPSRSLSPPPKVESQAPAVEQPTVLPADESLAGSNRSANDEARVQEINGDAMTKALDEVNQRVSKLTNNAVRFRIDEETGITVISVVDRDTDEVIRQIPPEEIMRINASISQFRGLLFDSQG